MFDNLCPYKNVVIDPKPFRPARRLNVLANLTIVDIIVMFAVAYVVSLVFKFPLIYSAVFVLVALLLLHTLLCRDVSV